MSGPPQREHPPQRESTIVELADWMGRNRTLGNPFEGAKVHRFHVGGVCLNYDDMMLVKAA